MSALAATLATKRTAALVGVAFSLLCVTPAFARGGGGGHGGGGHSSGGHSGGGHYSAPSHGASHYAAPAQRGSVGVARGAPMRGPAVGYRYGYLGGGRGAFVVGGRVPYFYGGPRGRLWWGPHYGWHIPAYWGGYYGPYVGYWGVSYWVTDWVMLDYLDAEEARMIASGGPNAVAVPATSAPIASDVREELRAQIAEILATPARPAVGATEQGNTVVVNDPRVARALAAPHHVFVVSHAVTVTDRTNGGTCVLTPGDLLRSSAPIPSGQSFADVSVAASKKASCSPGAVVALPIVDLVHFEEALLERVAKAAAAAKATDTETEPAPIPPSPVTPAPTPPAPPPSAVSPPAQSPNPGY